MEEKKYKYNQGDKVYFDLGENAPKGWGFINGIVGLVYILQVETAIKDYPFTHIYVVDSQITQPPV